MNKQKRGLYDFYVYRSARGGAYMWTPKLTLEVYCDVNSCTITEGAMDDNQVYEVGSQHGFYFNEFSQNTDCPITSYRIVHDYDVTKEHKSFIIAENVW